MLSSHPQLSVISRAILSPIYILPALTRSVLYTFTIFITITIPFVVFFAFVFPNSDAVPYFDGAALGFLVSLPISSLLSFAILPKVQAETRYCCQMCGYDLRGSTNNTCPECGGYGTGSHNRLEFDGLSQRLVSHPWRLGAGCVAVLMATWWVIWCILCSA